MDVTRNKGNEVIIQKVAEAADYYTKEGMGCVDRLNQNLKTNELVS